MIRLLIIEDDEDYSDMMKRFLKDADPYYEGAMEFTAVRTRGEAVELLAGSDFHAVLLDLTLADSTAEQTRTWLAENSEALPPVIVVTADPAEETRDGCTLKGAQHCVHKAFAEKFSAFLMLLIHDAIHRRYHDTHCK